MAGATQVDVGVFGAGSWGTTLAMLFARNGLATMLWGHDAARQARLAHERENAVYLPGFPFPDNLVIGDDIAALARTAKRIVVVVPSHVFRVTLQALAPHLPKDVSLAWASKGLEPDTGKRLSEVAREVLGARPFAVISGPSFAREVARGLPTALAVASEDAGLAERVAQWLRNDRLRTYTNNDVVGVEIGGALKNVMAIATGVCDGLGFGANARAALMTRGLAEITRLGLALGGRAETFRGLTGIGDLILTCTDDQSRNRRVGLGLGCGRKLGEVVAGLGQVAEGIGTAREAHRLAERVKVDMPICSQVYKVLFEDLSAQAAVEALLRREAKPE